MGQPKASASIPLQPLRDRVVIERELPKDRTAGGIIIPQTAKDMPKSGRVLAVGDGQQCAETGKASPMVVKVGDRVLFQHYAGTEIEIGVGAASRKLLIMSEGEILAVDRS